MFLIGCIVVTVIIFAVFFSAYSRSKPLIIEWEKGNRYDKRAKAVKRSNGQQLGYLHHEAAVRIHEDFFTPGLTWLALFKCANHHPETGRVVKLAEKETWTQFAH